MLNINFVPDDYVQNNEFRRTNFMYLMLFVVVMSALVGSFVTIKIRQRVCDAEEELVNEKMVQVQEAIKQFEEHEKEIGIELYVANIKLREQQKEENKLNICPVCKKGNLSITYSRKTKRQFVACDAYPDCKTTFSLPPNSLIKKTDKNCEECGFPRLMSLKRGKRPWIFCFNPNCITNKERIEEYKKRKEENKE